MYASLLLIFVAIAGGVATIKFIDQQARDHHRKTYRLSFPADLTVEHVTNWIHAVSGTLRYSPTRFNGVPTLAFELWSTSTGMFHRLKVPWQHADYIVGQLLAHIPGISYEPEPEFPRRQWTRAIEAGLTHSSRQLRIAAPEATAKSILTSVQPLEDDEAVMIQWIITPAVPTHPPLHHEAKSHHISAKTLMRGGLANSDEVSDRREKLEEPNVQAVLRVAAYAETLPRADHLIYRVRAALASARSASTRFHKRWVTKPGLQRRIDDTRSSVIKFPIQLTATELAALIAWPLGNPFVSGLPPARARRIPAPETVPKSGRIIGRSNMPGRERPIAVSYVDCLKHMHIIGSTGSGKTALLANMMKQDIEHGYGVVLIESKGDLFHRSLNYIPNDRLGDVIVLDVNDVKHPVGFNILEQGDPSVVIDELNSLFRQMFSNNPSLWTQEVLYHGLHTLRHVKGAAFTDLRSLVMPDANEVVWRDGVIRSLKDSELRAFWQRLDNQTRTRQDQMAQPLLSRIWELSRPKLRNILGQSKSSFQMSDVIRHSKILLVNLSGVERDTAALTGTLLINALWHAVRTTYTENATFLYVDEFQDFLKLPIDPEELLAKARGFGLGVVLAHQNLGQLSPTMRHALSANAATKVMFRAGVEDASAMARQFADVITEKDFMSLGIYEAGVQVSTSAGVSQPFTLSTLPPAKSHGLYQQVRDISRETYGRRLEDVEREVAQRCTAQSAPKSSRRPVIGSSPSFAFEDATLPANPPTKE